MVTHIRPQEKYFTRKLLSISAGYIKLSLTEQEEQDLAEEVDKAFFLSNNRKGSLSNLKCHLCTIYAPLFIISNDK